jgi:hypothetical protein
MSSKTERSDFSVFQEMSDKNMDISCAVEQLDFQRTPKRNGGRVTFGVASPYFDNLINQAATGVVTHHAILYIINKKHFDEIKKTEDSIKAKAAKWDALAKKMDGFYAEDSEADLGVIGEAAAQAFGYL